MKTIEQEFKDNKETLRIYDELIGKTFHFIGIRMSHKGEQDILRFVGDNNSYEFHHKEECCEYVRIEDVCGDLNDLINSPILQAEEVSRSCEIDVFNHETWTFYKFSTIKGSVTVRWLGESNGYYSESVDFREIKKGR